MKKKVLVFFGGQSTEHDISVLTGTMTAAALDGDKYEAVPVYISREGSWHSGETLKDVGFFAEKNRMPPRVCLLGGDNTLYKAGKNGKLKPLCKAACAINCLHGARGEDGALAAVAAMSGIPLVGSDIAASAVAFDKIATKTALKGLGIKTLPYVRVEGEEDLDEAEKKLGYPMMVKPARQGSSIGVNKAENRAEFERSVNKAKKFDTKVMAEKFAEGKIEINAAAYRRAGEIVVSECEMPATENRFLTFEDKYVKGERLFPAPVPKKLSDKIRAIAAKVYAGLDCSGVIRVDFLLVGGEPYVNEVNTVPGSMAYYLFSDTFEGFSAMLDEMIAEAMEDFNRRETLVKRFDCNILTSAGAKGGKRFDKKR